MRLGFRSIKKKGGNSSRPEQRRYFLPTLLKGQWKKYLFNETALDYIFFKLKLIRVFLYYFRRPRRTADQSSEDPAGHLKSSSELNLAAASTSVPIRTTRTSRLRAAAANHSDSSPSLRKSNRSSSAQSLEDVKTKKPKNAKIIERDKGKSNINRRQSHEKENLKSASSTCFPDKEIGAIRSKPKHSINKNILEKDKSNVLASSLKGKHNVDEKLNSKLDDKRKTNSSIEGTKSKVKDEERPLLVNGEDILDEILADNNLSDSLEKEKFEELFNDLVVEDKNVQENVAFKINEVSQDEELMLNDNKKIVNIPVSDEEIEVNNVKVEDSGVVPKVKDGGMGLLGVVCVPKVERFSELLSNLCSPCEADLLFEDILVENGIDGGGDIVSI